MTTQRRIGAPDAKNRTLLLDAAEQLMLADGYAAVTSRRLADKAGLKPQLVHYYFRTMDDLFLAMFRRRAEEGLQRQRELLESERPLRSLWEFNTDAERTGFIMEIASLAQHRKAIRAEVRRYSEQFRLAQLEVVAAVMERYHIPREVCTPAALVVLMTSVARVMSLEEKLDFSLGHKDAIDFMDRYLDQLEGFATKG
ncbi:TetR/AcrR family transcriptional regulator [Fodinicola acaciae]|uniref:TetR/AcrR family transcriptional regulator n=1 Tax=Fodinicola acaciae TaxID=2681555 RepID=UPI0013D20F88|nr:TetR/AcrR family transcriptional regulator [Fodinicola acaciae]